MCVKKIRLVKKSSYEVPFEVIVNSSRKKKAPNLCIVCVVLVAITVQVFKKMFGDRSHPPCILPKKLVISLTYTYCRILLLKQELLYSEYKCLLHAIQKLLQ